MKLLITGAKGQLGSEFVKFLKDSRYTVVATGKQELDVGSLEQVRKVFESFRPDIVINCSAYNQVDKAETEKELAYRVNAEGAKNLAQACEKYKSFLIHYSTDYVFDGKKEGLYTEDDPPNPLNEYAKSKLMGEKHVLQILENYLIFRTSWVYGEGKQNFLYKLIQWAQTQENLRIACDEFSVPTSTGTIVEVTLKAIQQGLTGLYHLVNSGYTSRFEWAREYLRLRGINKFIYPAYQSEFNLPAKRPRFSAMNNDKICSLLGIEIVDWKERLTIDVQKFGI